MAQYSWDCFGTKKIAMNRFRSLIKGSGILNIAGMAVAFASLYILLVQVYYEFGYNTGIKDYERIYTVCTPSFMTNGKQQPFLTRPIAESIIKASPDVEQYGASDNITIIAPEIESVFTGEGSEIKEFNFTVRSLTSGCMELLGRHAIEGTFANIENEENVAISQRAAATIGVGVGDAISFTKGGKKHTISAIFQDFPQNSSWNNIDIVYCKKIATANLDNISEWSYTYFVKLNRGSSKKNFEELGDKIAVAMLYEEHGDQYTSEQLKEICKITLIPINKIYFSDITPNINKSGNKHITYMLLAIALLTVCITLINFVNFTMSQAPLMMKEMCTRKIFGGTRGSLILNFLKRSVAIVLAALVLAYIIVLFFNGSDYSSLLSGTPDFSENIPAVVSSLAIAFLMTLAVSLYSAIHITSLSPAVALKGMGGMRRGGEQMRYMLICFQIILSSTFMITALFVQRQYNYAMKYDMGFNKEMLFSVNASNLVEDTKAEELAESLKSLTEVKDVTRTDSEIVSEMKRSMMQKVGDKTVSFHLLSTSWNFLDFMGINIIEGRNFNRSDEIKGTVIFNRSAVNEGIKPEHTIDGDNGTTEIIGICENFSFRPLKYHTLPMAIQAIGAKGRDHLYIYIRTYPKINIEQFFNGVREKITLLNPNVNPNSIEIKFFDSELEQQYIQEHQMSRIMGLASFASIFIALIGIFGIVLFETEYRRKEIGIRRVNGATILQILTMLNYKLIKITLAGFMAGAVIGYCIVKYYYSTFAYNASITWRVFALALLVIGTVVIAAATTGSYKRATENPAKSLKSE